MCLEALQTNSIPSYLKTYAFNVKGDICKHSLITLKNRYVDTLKAFWTISIILKYILENTIIN